MHNQNKVVVINGKRYKHISDFEETRNAIKLRIFRRKGEDLPVKKMAGGYYIEVDSKGNSKV